MNAQRNDRRRDQAETWLERTIPPQLLNAIVSALLLAGLGAVGIKVRDNGEVAEETKAAVGLTLEDLRNELGASYSNRVRTGTLTQSLDRIDRRLERIEKLMEERQ